MQGISLGKNAQELKEKLSFLLIPEEDKEQDRDEIIYYTSYFQEVMERKIKSTRDTYLHTLRRIRAFDRNADFLTFDDINKSWLEKFGIWLQEQGNSINTISIHYRNLRAVFNDAIDMGGRTKRINR